MNKGQLSVALLLSDLNEIKEISAVFRKLSIIPHFYEDLKTFFSGTAEIVPSLCIVDVLKMSEQELRLIDHPAVKNDQLPLVFFYNKSTEPLLVSTYDFFHLGLIKKQENYEGALKVILKRLNNQMKLAAENVSLKEETHKHVETIDRLKLERLTLEKTDQYQSMVKRVCLELEEERSQMEFFRAVEKVFAGIEEITEFSVLELNFNGQKLISPLSHADKFRTIPSLWLGQACKNGIELFAQNMATQVAIEIMGGDLVSLLIKGQFARPDMIIFIKSQNELFYNNFDWNMLEAYLNGLYASYRNIKDREIGSQKKVLSIFEAMSFLDQYLFNNKVIGDDTVNRDVRLVDLDLTHLSEVIAKKSSNRFFWNKFEKEFINKLEIQTRIDFKVFSFGVQHLSFIVEASKLDLFFDQLKDYAVKFAYWKYFEDSEGVLSQLITPKVSMVPLSSIAYLQAMKTSEVQKNNLLIQNTQEKGELARGKTRALIWGRENINEI